MYEYELIFAREYELARQELYRLRELLKDVMWYNFECECRNWEQPWRSTIMDSTILLNSHRYEWAAPFEVGIYPDYYRGPIRDAPPLPPQIVINEVKEAKRRFEECERQLTACVDWAPGGVLYEGLAKTTLVGRLFSPSTDGE